LAPTLTPKLVVADLPQSQKEVKCPSALETHLHDEEGQNPFPAKSLAICNRFEGVSPPFVLLSEVISNYGHCLTSVSLRNLNFKVGSFVEMLTHTQNLRACRMLDSFLSGISSSTTLPPLPRLVTLLLYFSHCEYRRTEHKESLKNLLLDCYSTQLITFDMALRSYDDIQPIKTPLSNLEQLKVFPINQRFLRKPTPAPFLKRLALKFKDFNNRVSIIEIMGYVDHFSGTLEHLYLDFRWSDVTKDNWTKKAFIIRLEGQIRGTLDSSSNDPLRKTLVEMNGKLASSSVTFSKLTSLAIAYPREDIDKALMVNTILPKFPAIEYLRLLHFRSFFDDALNLQLSPNLIKQYFLEEGYWRICPGLKRITVAKEENYENLDNVVVQVSR